MTVTLKINTTTRNKNDVNLLKFAIKGHDFKCTSSGF